MSLRVLHELVAFKPRGREQADEDTNDGSAVYLARLDAWIATVLTFPTG